MNPTPVKMFTNYLLLVSLLCAIVSYRTEVNAEPVRYNSATSALSSSMASNSAATAMATASSSSSQAAMGFISNPSIYTYTIANQFNTLNKSQQQQQQQQQQHKLKTSFTNEGGNTVYRNGASNRNFYYTNNGNNNNNANDASTFNEGSEFAFGSSLDSTAPESVYAHGNRASAAAAAAAATPAPPTQPPPMATGCNYDRLAVYKVVLHTYWTRELFPKHYPDWRPSAQWTKTLGRTHDSSYALYHIGQQATQGVKQFTETGKSEILDSVAGEQQQQQHQSIAGNSFTQSTQQQQQMQQRTSERSVFDEFTIPAILNGAGRSEAKLFVDSNHSLVSLMTRIVPSPDWFIGVDSFQLCVGGSWIDTVTVELDPLDAGTDNGFTFTAPNWPTSPQGVIYRITSRYPAHPAGSFFYPKSKRLPPIATFQFIKLKEYELSEVFNFAEDDRKYETVQTQTHLESEHNHVEMNNELSASIERERQNEISPSSSASGATASSSSLQGGGGTTERDRIRSKLLAKMNPMYTNNNSAMPSYMSTATTNDNGSAQQAAIPKNDKNALMQNIVNTYRRSSSTSAASSLSPSSSSRSTRRRRIKKGGSRDCRVGHWSEWSACSKTCGIGEMHRYRKVIKHGKRGGRPCPALQESKWCGTEKGCHNPASYFNWSNT